MRQKYFGTTFGFAGDNTVIPDPLQSGGQVSFNQGWTYDYQRDQTTDPAAKPIDRSTMNWLFGVITAQLQQYQQAAVPEWISATDNGGMPFPYEAGVRVRYSSNPGTVPFSVYVNLVAGNTNTPNLSDPTGATSNWQLAVYQIATSAQAAAGTDNSTIMTPSLVAQQTALRALLAGSSSQVFNVAPATASTHAMQLQQQAFALAANQNYTGNSPGSVKTASFSGTDNVVKTGTGPNNISYVVPQSGGQWSLTVNLASTGANGLDTGSVAANTWYAIYLIYNPTTNTAALLAQAAGVRASPNGSATETYSGANMPAGYTASMLLTVVGTDGSSNFMLFRQFGRWVTTGQQTIGTLTSTQSSPTGIALYPTIPAAAKEIKGSFGATNSTGGASQAVYLNLLSTADIALVGCCQFSAFLAQTGVQFSSAFSLLVQSGQNAWYTSNIPTGNSVAVLASAYRI